MKTILLSIFILLSNKLSAQTSDSILVTNVPVKNGKTNLFRENIGSIRDPASVIFIYSDSLDVFSLSEGIIKNIVQRDSAYTVVISSDNKYISYGNLLFTHCKIGDKIKPHQIIGQAKCDESKCFLIFQVADKHFSSNYYKTLIYLKKHNQFKK